jgi:hypothetical protein
MVINESDFRLTLIKDTSGIFDLELLKTINKGKENERQEFANVAYGVSLDTAIKYIANYRIQNKLESSNLETYLTEYRNIVKEITDCVRKITELP